METTSYSPANTKEWVSNSSDCRSIASTCRKRYRCQLKSEVMRFAALFGRLNCEEPCLLKIPEKKTYIVTKLAIFNFAYKIKNHAITLIYKAT